MSTLHRSKSNKWIGGVCGGLAETYSWNPTLTRLIYILLGLLLGAIPFIVIYIIAFFVIKDG